MEEEIRRKEAVVRYLAGEDPNLVCDELGRSKSWLYKWVKRFRNGAKNWFKAKSKSPKNIPNKTDPEVEKIVIDTRRKLENKKYSQIG